MSVVDRRWTGVRFVRGSIQRTETLCTVAALGVLLILTASGYVTLKDWLALGYVWMMRALFLTPAVWHLWKTGTLQLILVERPGPHRMRELFEKVKGGFPLRCGPWWGVLGL